MLTDEVGKQLHDKATRGKTLTFKEHKLLERWYDEQDKAESKSLYLSVDVESEQTLQRQIELTLIKIESATDQIHKLANENQSLRNDITRIHRQLSEKTMAQTI